MAFVAQYSPGSLKTGIAGAAVASRRFVSLSGAKLIQTAAKASATFATVKPIAGVSIDSADADGDAFSYCAEDGAIVIVEAGAAISAGVEVSPDSTGRAVAFSETTSQYNLSAGVALDAAGAAGDFIRVMLRPYKYKA